MHVHRYDVSSSNLSVPEFVVTSCCGHTDYQDPGGEGIIVSNKQSYFFEVKASNDVHVGLFTTRGDTSVMYEFVIGGWGNSKSVIRTATQGTNLAQHLSSPLNSNKYRRLWVSWGEGHLKVGTGFIVGKNAFLQYDHANPYAVNYVMFSGWNSDIQLHLPQGKWMMPSNAVI